MISSTVARRDFKNKNNMAENAFWAYERKPDHAFRGLLFCQRAPDLWMWILAARCTLVCVAVATFCKSIDLAPSRAFCQITFYTGFGVGSAEPTSSDAIAMAHTKELLLSLTTTKILAKPTPE